MTEVLQNLVRVSANQQTFQPLGKKCGEFLEKEQHKPVLWIYGWPDGKNNYMYMYINCNY